MMSGYLKPLRMSHEDCEAFRGLLRYIAREQPDDIEVQFFCEKVAAFDDQKIQKVLELMEDHLMADSELIRLTRNVLLELQRRKDEGAGHA